MLTRIVLIRHGESQWNAAGLMQGHRGPGLSERGHREAKATAAMLARRYADAAAIVRSDLPRVVETAEPAEQELGITATADPRLRELDLGSWAGRDHADVRAAHGEDLDRWLRGIDVDSHGGETFTQMRSRVEEVLGELAERYAGRTVLVFSHGGPIRMAAAAVLGLSTARLDRLTPTSNCAVTVLSARDGRLQVVTYNEQAHLADIGGSEDEAVDPPA